MNISKNPIRLFQAATVCVFAGRAYQHFFFDIPIREILWDADWVRVLVTSTTGLTWQEYLTSPASEHFIQSLTYIGGWLYLICALVALFWKKLGDNLTLAPNLRFLRWLLWLGTAGLLFLAFLYTKESFMHVGQFLEYTLQVGAPIFLLLATKRGKGRLWNTRLLLALKLAVAFCFACHGLYAIGYYPRPGLFMEMSMRVLQLSEKGALLFLNTVGALDFVVAVCIFLPGKAGRWACLYAAAWGMATALARVMGNFYLDFPLDSLHQWVYQAVYRLPHCFLPLAAWLLSNNVRFKPATHEI